MSNYVARLTSMRVLGRRGNTVFIRLPAELQVVIEGPRCRCDHCSAHPDELPAWDTLAVTQAPTRDQSDYTWTVHMPDARDARE